MRWRKILLFQNNSPTLFENGAVLVPSLSLNSSLLEPEAVNANVFRCSQLGSKAPIIAAV
jgi:hypothetical protein